MRDADIDRIDDAYRRGRKAGYDEGYRAGRAHVVMAGAESRVPELTREDFDPRNALEEMIVQRYMNKVPLGVIEVRNILTALRTSGVALVDGETFSQQTPMGESKPE